MVRFQEFCWDRSLWTHPPARRRRGAGGRKDSSPCHPRASEGPGGARAPGGGEVVTARPSLPPTPLRWLWPYLGPVAHLQERTGRVEGPSAAGQHVGAVVGVQQLHEVHALGLAGSQGGMVRPPRGVAFRGSRSPAHPTFSFLLHQLRQVPACAPGTWGPSVTSPAQPTSQQNGYPGKQRFALAPVTHRPPRRIT